MSDTNDTTMIMRVVSLSTRKPISMLMPSVTIQVYTAPLKGSAPSRTMCLNTTSDSRKDIATPIMVTQWAPERPITLPNSPATMAPNRGARTMVR